MSETTSSDKPIYCGPTCPQAKPFEQIVAMGRSLVAAKATIVDRAADVGMAATSRADRQVAEADLAETGDLMAKANRFQDGMDTAAEAVRQIPCDPAEARPDGCPRFERYRAAFALAFRPPQV